MSTRERITRPWARPGRGGEQYRRRICTSLWQGKLVVDAFACVHSGEHLVRAGKAYGGGMKARKAS
jgi:hypothetical protein